MRHFLLHQLTMTIAVFLLLAAGALQCCAFWPPLQAISVSTNANSVQLQVYDTQRQQWMKGSIAIVPAAILNQDGIVACWDLAGHVAFAAYDPNAGSWNYGYGSWGGAMHIEVSGGVVALG